MTHTTPIDPAAFIHEHAARLVKISILCAMSFGLADGLNDALKSDARKDDDDWRQAVRGFQDGTLMMAALRASALLDRDNTMVSFQTFHQRFKQVDVRTSLARKFAEHDQLRLALGEASTLELIEQFNAKYSEIDWKTHGRLVHFRNRGIAHLSVERMSRSITYDELRTFVDIIIRLGRLVGRLCQVEIVFHQDVANSYRELALSAVMPTNDFEG